MLDRIHAWLTGSARPRGAAEPVAITGALVLALAAFGFELTNPTLGVDDFAHLDVPFAWDSFYIGRGTWGALVVQYLTPGAWITPFVSLAIGIVLQLATAVVLGWLLGVAELQPLARTLLYAMFAAFPYFACQMAFSYVQISYPLASMLMVCSVALALAGDARRALCAVLASGFAVSIYQGSLSVLAPVALLAPAMGARVGASGIIRRYARVLIVLAAGGALYAAVHLLVLAVTGVTARSRHYSVSFDWRFWERWEWIRREVRFLLLGAGDVIPMQAVAVFLLAAVLLVLFGSWRRQSNVQRVASLALRAGLAALAVLAPFAVMFVHFGELAPRSAVGVAVVWFAVFASMLSTSPSVVRGAATAAIAVIVAFFVFQDNRMFYSQHLVTQADGIMMARIAERIDQLPLERSPGPTPVVFIGQYSHPPYQGMPRFKGEVIGYSQFEWDLIDTRWAIRGLARSIGVDHYTWHDVSELGSAFRDPGLLANRQPWPHKSSVFAYDGYAVVWLGSRREEPRVAPLDSWLASLTGRHGR